MIKLWVGNLPYKWTAEHLIGYTGAKSGHVMLDENKRSRGWGWIEIDAIDVDKVLALHDTEVDGMKIKVKHWNNKEKVNANTNEKG